MYVQTPHHTLVPREYTHVTQGALHDVPTVPYVNQECCHVHANTPP
jgi:hypothetical protein